jgi:hypothetical protein
MRGAVAARRTLGLIRIVNGALALAAPGRLADRLGVGAEERPAVLYALRMFGVRTILIGRDLFVGDERAVRSAPLVHASDTIAAAAAAASGKLPGRAGRLITGISAVNTLLAFAARRSASVD